MASEQFEEYLESLGKLEERGEPITTSSLARERHVALPSVTEMLRRLSELGLVVHQPRGEIALTDKGRVAAHAVMRRHRLWERFLHDVLGMRADRVHLEACKLEHATSPALEVELSRAIGDSDACPHGRAIPPDMSTTAPTLFELDSLSGKGPLSGSGEVENGDSDSPPPPIPLAQLRPGETGRVEGLTSSRSSTARCLALGFTPGTYVTMLQNGKSGPVIVLIRDTRVALGRGEAQKVLITRKVAGLGTTYQPE